MVMINTVISKLKLLLEIAKAEQTVEFLTLKVDGLRESHNFTLLTDYGTRIGDFELGDVRVIHCKCCAGYDVCPSEEELVNDTI